MGGDVATWPGLPYALLFLEWEARYPLECPEIPNTRRVWQTWVAGEAAASLL